MRRYLPVVGVMGIMIITVGLFFSACAPATPQVIEKEVVVEKPVVQTVIVEKEVEKKVVETVVVEKEVERKVVETVVVEKHVEKLVYETVIVEKAVVETVIVEVEKKAEAPTELWYDPARVGAPWWHICPNDPPTYGGTIFSSRPPMAYYGGNWFRATWNEHWVFNQLLRTNPDTLMIDPELAKSWKASADGRTYTFELQEGVKFHDGEPFTAEDVEYTIMIEYHPDNLGGFRSYLTGIVGIEEWGQGETEEIAGVKVIDDYTIEVTIESPNSMFLEGIGRMNIFPKHLLKDIPFGELQASKYGVEAAVGTGPFKMTKFVADQYVVCDAFEDYWEGRPYLDKVIFRLGIEESDPTWMAALEANELQEGSWTSGPDITRLGENDQLVVVGAPLNGAVLLIPNHDNFPDKRVLQALMYALDLKSITESVWGPGQAVVYDPLGADPNAVWVDRDVTWYSYDPDKAKQLLEAAGYDGRELKLIYYYGNEIHKRTVTALQQQWAEVGVKVNMIFTDPASLGQVYWEEADTDFLYGCCSPVRGEQWSRYNCDGIYPAGYNGARYCNEEFDALVQAGLAETDPEKQKEIWYEVSKIFAEELPLMPLYQEVRVMAGREELCNFNWRQADGGVAWPERYVSTWYLKQ